MAYLRIPKFDKRYNNAARCKKEILRLKKLLNEAYSIKSDKEFKSYISYPDEHGY